MNLDQNKWIEDKGGNLFDGSMSLMNRSQIKASERPDKVSLLCI